VNTSSAAHLRNAVIWSYRLLLGREPENDEVIEQHLRQNPAATIDAIRQYFMASQEYLNKSSNPTDPISRLLANVPLTMRDQTLYAREAGFFRDMFGVKTRLSYLPAMYQQYSGGIAGDFGMQHLPMHDACELRGVMEALHAAQGSFAVMELGAGWGPWIAMCASVARRMDLPFRLIAVEGSAEHVGYIHTHLHDNDVDPAQHRILHGVAAANDGQAGFLKLAGFEYGATIMEQGSDDVDQVASYSISSLLRDEPVLDIIHCDVQGHEVDVLSAGIGALGERVRRIIIGTHGRDLEQCLFDLFGGNHWQLVEEMPCIMTVQAGRTVLVQDGAQYWVNPRLGPVSS
jgi:FkbM family methyltransferase